LISLTGPAIGGYAGGAPPENRLQRSTLLGYIHVSRSGGTQTREPQRDTLVTAGVPRERIR
jgi:hypothetical protein